MNEKNVHKSLTKNLQRYELFADNDYFCKFKIYYTMTWTIDITSTWTLLSLAVFCLSAVIVCVYYSVTYWRVAGWRGKKVPPQPIVDDARQPKVSIVLTVHNEAAYLKESLPYLLEQDYPDYEVVVVNYLSKDDTPFVLKVCAENYSSLKPLQFTEDVNMFQGKKYPLSIGIRSASGEVIVLTEADCIPKSFTWLRGLVAGYQAAGVQMVLGYAGVRQEKGLLNLFQQYDNLTESASWMGFAMAGMPYSGTGRNLSFRRQFFFDQGSFIRHYSEPEGADDMFVNQNASGDNTTLCLEADSFVTADAKQDRRLWHRQRVQRWATKRYYSASQKFLLGLYPSSVLLFYAALAVLLALHFPWQYVAMAWVLKTAWQVWSFSRFSKRLEIKNVHFYSPLLEIYFLFANTFLFLSTLHKNKRRIR